MIKDIYGYKHIFRNKDMRLKILKKLSFVPDSIMLPLQYRIKLGRWPNLNNPVRWTEKLQLYKMFYRNPILPICVDKYEVRNYIESRQMGEILVRLYGVYDRADKIIFSTLPNSFVIKTTDGGGGNNVIIVKDKKDIDINKTIKDLNSWLNIKDINAGREWAYTGIKKSRIIIEEFLVNPANPDGGIEDFKFLCFGGEIKYIIVDAARYINHKRNFYTKDWNRVNVTSDHDQFEWDFPKPKNLDRMIDIAEHLSKDFPFVRVDLYNVQGKIYFGELTFYPWSGYVQFTPDSFDFELGSYMDINSFFPR